MFSKVLEQMILGKIDRPVICQKFQMTPSFYSKAICALTNSGGGYIIIGIEKEVIGFTTIGFSKNFNYDSVINKSLEELSSRPNIYSEIVHFKSKNILIIEVSKTKRTTFFRDVKYIVSNSEIVKCEGEIRMDMNKVFIVHGHDNEAKVTVARFIERVGLESVILHEQASQGKTIIEKIEANSNVGFAIVLYTPCDEGKSKGQELFQYRARQNVVFEHGYLIGKLGRTRVCALVKGEVEKPNDISGVVYIPFDEAGAWKIDLIKEMQSLGYELDMQKVFL
ncbi:TIR domain-containing protein [Enterococcus sp. AZ192]|uniref:TIR domain-containing protein n=1 Tax=unclassified Enterococcus TaxID=2608891 RepID=UPI003D2D7240